jgi:hypothetical protein
LYSPLYSLKLGLKIRVVLQSIYWIKKNETTNWNFTAAGNFFISPAAHGWEG